MIQNSPHLINHQRAFRSSLSKLMSTTMAAFIPLSSRGVKRRGDHWMATRPLITRHDNVIYLVRLNEPSLISTHLSIEVK